MKRYKKKEEEIKKDEEGQEMGKRESKKTASEKII